MLCLLATLSVLGAAPGIAVVKRSTSGVSEQVVALVLRTVEEGLRSEGLNPQSWPGICSDDRVCLGAAAKLAKTAAAVGVTVIRGRRDITVDLEAVDANQQQLAVQTFSVPSKGEPFPPEGIAFFNSVARRVKRDDAPREVRLTPEPAQQPAVEVIADRSPAAGISAGVTIAAGVATIALVIAGIVVKGQLDAAINSGRPVAPLTRAAAEAKASTANALFSASLAAGGLTAAAAATTLVLFAQDD